MAAIFSQTIKFCHSFIEFHDPETMLGQFLEIGCRKCYGTKRKNTPEQAGLIYLLICAVLTNNLFITCEI